MATKKTAAKKPAAKPAKKPAAKPAAKKATKKAVILATKVKKLAKKVLTTLAVKKVMLMQPTTQLEKKEPAKKKTWMNHGLTKIGMN